MKRLLTFNQLNELSNWNFVKFYIDKMWNEINKIKIPILGSTLKDRTQTIEYFNRGFGYEAQHYDYTIIRFDSPMNESITKQIDKILNKYEKILESQNTHMIFESFGYYGSSNIKYTIYIKDKYTKRIKPNKYIYHCSDSSNRESILKNGLIPKKHSESPNWSDSKDLTYPSVIFATNSEIEKVWRKHIDIWRIDTENLPNKWWKDLNLSDTHKAIMTFDPIPPEYIKLVKSGGVLLIDNETITEKIHNKKLVEYEIERMLSEISKFIPEINDQIFKSNLGKEDLFSRNNKREDNIHFQLRINEDQFKFIKSIDNILKKYKVSVFPKIYVVMKVVKYIDEDKSPTLKDEIIYKFAFKNIYLKRIIPKRYVFHRSDEKNRKNIEKNGLMLRSDEDSIWKNEQDVVYPPSVFAVDAKSFNSLWSMPHSDIWVIDTKGLPNKWWYDLYYTEYQSYIMTFDPIPIDHLKSVSKLNAEKIIQDQNK